MWLNQGVGHINSFLRVFKQSLIDMNIQTLNMDIREMDRLCTYKILKASFRTGSNLFNVKNRVLQTFLPNLEGGY